MYTVVSRELEVLQSWASSAPGPDRVRANGGAQALDVRSETEHKPNDSYLGIYTRGHESFGRCELIRFL